MSFTFRHQPLKTVYFVGSIFVLVLFRVPFWAAINLLPSVSTIVGIGFNDTSVPQPISVENASRDAEKMGFVWVDPAPEYVVGELAALAEKNNVQFVRTWSFWWGPKGPNGEVGQKAQPGDKVVMQIHDLQQVGSAHPSDPFSPAFHGIVAHYPKNVCIFGIDYCLSSAAPFPAQNPFPTALLDCLAGFRYLVEAVGFAPADVIVGGDSAGASLALALVHFLAQQRFLIPGGLALFSPALDWTLSHDTPGARCASTRTRTMRAASTTRDARSARCRGPSARRSWTASGSRRAQRKPGDYALPRMIVLVGKLEMMVDATQTLRDRLVEDMGEDAVTYVEVNATHDSIIMFLLEPERTDILQRVAAWLEAM
ncbi:alpha/beta-hydrolase [Amylocystis lapponica]|nr:alpha/beta-hydrolase [Amylocystis lapponica]